MATAKSRYDRALSARYLREIHRALGGRCARCGFSDPRALQIDHIGGGGSRYFKSLPSANRRFYYRQVLRAIADGREEYQILCANCNWIKRFTEDSHDRPVMETLAQLDMCLDDDERAA